MTDKRRPENVEIIPLRRAVPVLVPQDATFSDNPVDETDWEQVCRIQAFDRAWIDVWKLWIGQAALSGDTNAARLRIDEIRDDLYAYVGTIHGDGHIVIGAIDNLLEQLQTIKPRDRKAQRRLLKANRKVTRELEHLRRQILQPSRIGRLLGSSSRLLEVSGVRRQQIQAATRTAALGLSNTIARKMHLPQDVQDALNFFGVPFWEIQAAEQGKEEARSEYLRLATEHHPDKSREDVHEASKQMVEANRHWEVLKRWSP